MIINFRNVASEKIQDCFKSALSAYHELHDYSITLNQKRIKSSTMQAQPVINLKNIFTGIKKYQIKLAVFVSSSSELKVRDIPDKVLVGWFAHELGHIKDYVSYSNIGMINYGLKYIVSDSFKMKTEHEADYNAIKKGFKSEILATKEWVLNHDLVGQDYKDKLNKYYLSREEVELCNLNDLPFKPIVE